MTSFRSGEVPRTIAHRGGSGIRPENTLEAFRHAHSLGIRTFELDVHLSSDGQLVVHHDLTVDRTTNGTGPVATKTVLDLRALDAGHRFVDEQGRTPFRGKGIAIPTLAEVVDAFPDVSFIVELKPRGDRVVAAVRRFVDEREVGHRLCVAGFDEPTLVRYRRLPGARSITSAGSSAITRLFAASRVGLEKLAKPSCQMIQVPPSHNGLRVIDRRFVDAAHRLGVEVHAWTIDEPGEMRELLALGVDAIITDRPDRMVEVDRTFASPR